MPGRERGTAVADARPRYVLDSYAVLAWLQGEPGAAIVSDILRQAGRDEATVSMCLVNLGEVLYIIEREESLPVAQRALATIDDLPVRLHPADRDLVLAAAHVKARHRMAYADCFAVALAARLGARLVTGDPEIREQKDVELVWIGPEN